MIRMRIAFVTVIEWKPEAARILVEAAHEGNDNLIHNENLAEDLVIEAHQKL